jgi:hypothetical protein
MVGQTAPQFTYKMVDIRPQEVLTNMHFAYKWRTGGFEDVLRIESLYTI